MNILKYVIGLRLKNSFKYFICIGNGDPNDPNSLHHFSAAGRLNPYVLSIKYYVLNISSYSILFVSNL